MIETEHEHKTIPGFRSINALCLELHCSYSPRISITKVTLLKVIQTASW